MICETLATETLQQHTQYKRLPIGERITLYGSMIKNNYDHERINFNKKYNPIRINIDDNLFYGLELRHTKMMDEIVDKIMSVPFNHPDHVDMYRKRLKMYGLSCDTCWKYMKRKIFPIDSLNIQKVAINSPYNMKNSLSMITIKEDLPWFTQYTDFKIFILNNR